MNRLASFLACFFIGPTIALADPPERAIGTRDKPRFAPVAERTGHAGLFVGVNQFTEDSGLATLNCAVNDAVSQAHVFVLELKLIAPDRAFLALSGDVRGEDAERELAALKAAGVTMGEAGKAKIFRQLQNVIALPQSEADLLVVALSSHGFEEKGTAYVMPADGVRAFLADTAINMTSIEEALAKSKAGKRLLLLDACRERPLAGGRGGGAGMSGAFRSALAAASGQAVLASCDVGQVSFEDAASGHGVFTRALLNALRGGAAADAQGLILLDEVTRYVAREVEAWSTRHGPQKQLPWFKGPDVARRIPLAVDPKAAEAVQKRLKAIRSLFVDGKIKAELFDEADRLMTQGASNDIARRRLEVYERLADGQTDAETARMALLAIPMGIGSRPQIPGKPLLNGSNTEPVNEVKLDLGEEVTLVCVLIPAGEFMMGSPEDEEERSSDEGPQHLVRIGKPLLMGKFEVTNRQYRRYKEDHDVRPYGGMSVTNANQPVVGVSWDDAHGFCEWMSKRIGKTVRLPSEAEWEYAARCGEGRVFPWGDRWPPASDRGNYADKTLKEKCPNVNAIIEEYNDGYCVSAPVGSFESNKWGLYDMGGNVYEWCEDNYHRSYEGAPADGKAWCSRREEIDYRIMRGGNWLTCTQRDLRAAKREGYLATIQGFGVGFRVVVDNE